MTTAIEAVIDSAFDDGHNALGRQAEKEYQELIAACRGLIEYRDRNVLNFQLEKADDFINVMRWLVPKA